MKKCPEYPLWYDLIVMSEDKFILSVAWPGGPEGITDKKYANTQEARSAVKSIHHQVNAGAGVLRPSLYGWVFYPTCTKGAQ